MISEKSERGMKFREQGREAIKGELIGNELPVLIYSHLMMQMVCLHASTVQYTGNISVGTGRNTETLPPCTGMRLEKPKSN